MQFKHNCLMRFAIHIYKAVLYCDLCISPVEGTTLCWEIRCSSHRTFDAGNWPCNLMFSPLSCALNHQHVIKQARGYYSNATQPYMMKEACGLEMLSFRPFQGLERDSKLTYQNNRDRRFRKAWSCVGVKFPDRT